MITSFKKWTILFLLSVLLCCGNLLNFFLTYKTVHQCSTSSTSPGFGKPLLSTTSVKRLKWNESNLLTHISSQNTSYKRHWKTFQHFSNEQDCYFKKDPLERYICEVESFYVFYTTKTHPLVVARDLSILRYYAQRDLQGWTLAYRNISFEVTEQAFKQSTKFSDISVLLCLGIVSQDRYCLKPSAYKNLGQGQKINQIHNMRDTLWRKDGFCFTLREALHGYRGWHNFTFPCWVLPQDKDALEKEMSRTTTTDYIVKPAFRGEGHGIYVVRSFKEISHSTAESYVIQPFLKRPYLVRGRKFDFRTYVLVTSISPPRVYFYKEGLVRFASSKYNYNATRGGKEQQYLTNTSVGKKFAQLSNLTWTYERLCKYLEKRNVNTTKLFDSIRNAITRTILASEFRFLSDIK